jgi:hypothetical protein
MPALLSSGIIGFFPGSSHLGWSNNILVERRISIERLVSCD